MRRSPFAAGLIGMLISEGLAERVLVIDERDERLPDIRPEPAAPAPAIDRHKPHQGAKERGRRLRQMGAKP